MVYNTIGVIYGKNTFYSQHSGGDLIIVWGCFTSNGSSEMGFLEGRQDTSAYCRTLQTHLLHFAKSKFGNSFAFQHGDASCHIAIANRCFLSEQYMQVLE